MTIDFPKMIRIRQDFKRPKVEDPALAVKEKITSIKSSLIVTPGQTVAIACGSRGLAAYPELVCSIVSSLKAMGLKPFLVPCMGSHGAGSAEGQKRVLEHLGLTPERVGAPIHSSLEVEKIGEIQDKVPVYVDKIALQADHIVLINRIKKHTDFVGPIESGLMKLMVIGLGKMKGAGFWHQAMISMGASNVIQQGARHVLGHCNILFGVGTIENSFGEVADIGVFTPGEIEEGEKTLFEASKKISAGLPFEDVDILHIDEIGKEISGAGFDTRVVGRIRLPGTPEPESPRVKRIILSDLTKASEGNAIGLGISDIITQRLADKVDQSALDTNTIISLCLEMGKTPLIMSDDRAALELAMKCVGMIPAEKQKTIRIKNTLEVIEVEVSEAYASQISERDDLKIICPARKISFTPDGYYTPFYDH